MIKSNAKLLTLQSKYAVTTFGDSAIRPFRREFHTGSLLQRCHRQSLINVYSFHSLYPVISRTN